MKTMTRKVAEEKGYAVFNSCNHTVIESNDGSPIVVSLPTGDIMSIDFLASDALEIEFIGNSTCKMLGFRNDNVSCPTFYTDAFILSHETGNKTISSSSKKDIDLKEMEEAMHTISVQFSNNSALTICIMKQFDGLAIDLKVHGNEESFVVPKNTDDGEKMKANIYAVVLQTK
jgi:hypothetical protein